MLIYVIQILLIIAIGLFLKPAKSEKRKKIFLRLTFVILAFVACFRNYTVGYDTKQYVIAFGKAAELSINTFSNLRYEYGFTFLCWILNKITSNWQILLIVSSLFINYSVLKFIKNNSSNPLLSVLMYILMNFYFFYTSAMRQAIAIGIMLLGYEKLKKNEIWKFLIFVLIATLFHESAFLALLLIPMRKMKYNRYFIFSIIGVYIIGFILGKDLFLFLSRFSNRLLDYSDSKFFVENYFGALLQFLLNFFVFITGYITMLKKERKILYDKTDVNNLMIGILAIGNLFLLLTVKVGIFNRFSPYFSIFIIIWLPNMIVKIKNAKNRMLICTLCLSILVAYWGIISIYRPEWYGMIPYQFSWIGGY